MDSWANMEWHYEVHHRFGEQLVYYLLRVRPYEAEIVFEKLTSLLTRHKLESVRIFKVFGANDLLIRAWLHSQVTPDFPEWLRDSLVYDIGIKTFTVTALHMISSLPPEVSLPDNSDLLNSLYDEDTIRAVQNGHDYELLEKLINTNIVFTRDQQGPDPIKFFLAVHLSQDEERIHADAARVVCNYVQDQMATISKTSVYRGVGFCDILIKGDVVGENFFSIGELIDWIYGNLKKYGATTETYIVAWPQPLVETPDRISESTFKAIHGKNLFVQSVIPELYDRFWSKRKEIEGVIAGASKQVVVRYKKLVNEYLVGYLEGKNPEMGKVLFTFFTELEEYLRDNYKEFVGRNDLSLGKTLEVVGVPSESRKHITLGHLFNLYSYVIKLKQLSDKKELTGDWNGLVELRNKPLHGNLNYREDWASSLQILLDYLPRVSQLLTIIYESTGKDYNFTYLPPIGNSDTKNE